MIPPHVQNSGQHRFDVQDVDRYAGHASNSDAQTPGRQIMSSVNFEGLVEHRAYAHGDAGKPEGSTSSPIASSDSMPC